MIKRNGLEKVKQYLKNLLIAIDQLINAIFGGYCDETISAMAYRNYSHGRWWGVVLKNVIDFVFSPFEKDHCFQSYLVEKRRGQLPEEYRKCRQN